MGGDGGTLNNSRHEHTRMRQSVLNNDGNQTPQDVLQRQRASTTHCTLSHVPLRPPHVVADRLGQFYDKEALLRHILRRRLSRNDDSIKGINNGNSDHDPVPHIHSIRNDTVQALLISSSNPSDSPQFICPVSARSVVPHGRFSIGWKCGCVTHDDNPHDLNVCHESDVSLEPQFSACPACGVSGPRIPLGLTLRQRIAIRDSLVKQRSKKRSHGSRAAQIGIPVVKKISKSSSGSLLASTSKNPRL